MSDEQEKHYSNGEITVVWKPQLCKHTGICARGLHAVFDPKRRPWIDVSKATSEQIVAQVKQCPSGALSLLPTTK
ncbi:MAG: (4Fe-4S)-binding protein [Archangium sp.]